MKLTSGDGKPYTKGDVVYGVDQPRRRVDENTIELHRGIVVSTEWQSVYDMMEAGRSQILQKCEVLLETNKVRYFYNVELTYFENLAAKRNTCKAEETVV